MRFGRRREGPQEASSSSSLPSSSSYSYDVSIRVKGGCVLGALSRRECRGAGCWRLGHDLNNLGVFLLFLRPPFCSFGVGLL